MGRTGADRASQSPPDGLMLGADRPLGALSGSWRRCQPLDTACLIPFEGRIGRPGARDRRLARVRGPGTAAGGPWSGIEGHVELPGRG